jgi:peptide/nickel transport system permease protein
MLAFILRRLGQSVLVLGVVSLLAFTMFRFVGDPVNQLVGQDTTSEQRAQIRQDLGLNDAVIVQYSRFIGRAVRFDFGISYQSKQAVTQLIRERMPATLELALMSALFALGVGIPMGVYTGLNRHSCCRKCF